MGDGRTICVRMQREQEREREIESLEGDAWSEKGDMEHTQVEDAYSSEVDCAKARPYTLISPIASRTIMRLPKIGERCLSHLVFLTSVLKLEAGKVNDDDDDDDYNV